jgi:Ni,Fe-hydrogenase III large subunit
MLDWACFVSDLDEISVAIGRLQAMVESQTDTLKNHGDAHSKILNRQEEMMAACALIPSIQEDIGGLEVRTNGLEKDRDERSGRSAVIGAVTGFIGACIIKFGDVLFK